MSRLFKIIRLNKIKYKGLVLIVNNSLIINKNFN